MKKNRVRNRNDHRKRFSEENTATPSAATQRSTTKDPGTQSKNTHDIEGSSVDVFADPRQQRERRVKRELESMPDIGCRRRQRRRNRAYTNDEVWWTKRSYNDRE